MYKCKCGSTKFKTKMVTTANVTVTTNSGYSEHILGTEDTTNINFSGPYICANCGIYHMDIEESEENNETITYKRCSCGNTRFTAKQLCYHDVIVNGNNIFTRDIAVSEAENPYGTYCCTKCGMEYESLDELDNLPINKERCVKC